MHSHARGLSKATYFSHRNNTDVTHITEETIIALPKCSKRPKNVSTIP
jgi:hypothetical protein